MQLWLPDTEVYLNTRILTPVFDSSFSNDEIQYHIDMVYQADGNFEYYVDLLSDSVSDRDKDAAIDEAMANLSIEVEVDGVPEETISFLDLDEFHY